MKEDMYLARSSDDEISKRAECGGVVTSLLKFALESKMVDAVLAVKARDGNRYDGVPVLITDPEAVIETGGSLHCASPNIARFLKEYLNGAFDTKIAVVCKPCDARAIIELAKRTQIEMDNLILIGLNCTGTLPSATAKQMFREEFGVNPADIIREDLEEGKLTITLKDGTEKQQDLDELEQKGYGRRDNCRRCDINIPIMADIACGKWGTDGKKATFIEVRSEKGSDLIEKAIEAGYIKVEKPDSAAIE
ncbi:MAG: Coenzyme F420 hydrogenase/dehydrogenase, beta subunit C-terminal domain, partial [Dehalococcoidia bacterium]|nr:Coenzyme F420 hydrogenase/dehydrogenase, beta subunit C-terminal domain [Dehalococcoidia bacterium]